MNWFALLFAAVFCVAWFFTVRYDVQMFQQNSYRRGRYFTWLKGGNLLAHRRGWTLLLPLLALDGRTAWGAAALMGWLAEREAAETYRQPLVFTARVKRLYATCAVLCALTLYAAWTVSPAVFYAAAGGILVLSNLFMLLADAVNKPLERAIGRWYYCDARRRLESMRGLRVIGITGSFGKTSTKHFLYRILSEKYNVLMTPGNYNTTLGVVRTIRERLRPHHQVFLVEMGAKQRGDIREICELVHPETGIVTSVGEMHLETFGSLENVRRTKFELIDALPEGGTGVVNLDSEPIALARPARPTVGYAIAAEGADYRAVNVSYTPAGTTFDVQTPAGLRKGYETKLLGEGNLLDILACLVVADRLGVPERKQRIAVAQLQPVEHRLSRRTTPGRVTVLDDAYNSNPQGARMALAVLREFRIEAGGRRIVVTPGFVELGARQAAANRVLGREMAAACDYAVVVNATNREAIAAGLAEAGFPADRIVLADTFAEASARLAGCLRAGDVVLYENDLPDSFR